LWHRQGDVDLAEAAGPSGRVDAMDLSEEMLEQARSKIEKSGFHGRIFFKQGNAKELPYPV
jgi:ubiquinone/menaquinone biosynthesis C-methylase UbiE